MKIPQLLLAAALFAPQIGAAQPSAELPNIASVLAVDTEMNAAKIKGNSTLPEFFSHWAEPSADESNFTVKFNLTPYADAEFIWAGDLKRAGGVLTGILENDPISPRFKIGQRVVIADKFIVDWGYLKKNVMRGHVTTRVILDRMPTEEAAPIRRQLGW